MFEIKIEATIICMLTKGKKINRHKLILITWLACGGGCMDANIKFYDEEIQLKKK